MARCPQPESHEAHMALNGECPWCPEVNESAIDDEALRSLIGEQEYAAIREAERRT